MDKLAQVILVSRTGSHEDVVAAAAAASLRVHADRYQDELLQPEAWAEWLGGRFTKSVRAVKSHSHLARTKLWATDAGYDASTATSGDATAVALNPTAVADLPKFIRGARVAGLEREPGPQALQPPAQVALQVLDTLSTGKAAAQAAHALWMAYLVPQDLNLDADTWAETGHLFTLELVSADELAAAEGLAVVDAGLTEIEPGTLTAKALRVE